MRAAATQPPMLSGVQVTSAKSIRGSQLMSNNAYGSLAGEINNSTYAALAVGLLVATAVVTGYINGAVNLRVGK